MAELNIKQSRFARLYVELGNAARAYVKAGYKADRADAAAAILMKKPHVQARIQELKDQQLSPNNVTQQGILSELITIAQDKKTNTGQKIKALETAARVAGFMGGDIQIGNDNRQLTLVMPDKSTKTIELNGSND